MNNKDGRRIPGDSNTWFSNYKTARNQYDERNNPGIADFVGVLIAGAIVVGLLYWAGIR